MGVPNMFGVAGAIFRWRGLIAVGRTAVALVLAVFTGFSDGARAGEPGVVRAGVLAFGTVNWELDVVRHHGLDSKRGFRLQVVKLASKNATAVALQGGAADTIVTDWLWVSRQRHGGTDYTFVPHSLAVGGLMVHPDGGINTVADLKGRRIGIAGGPVDKSWLLLRAYGIKTIGFDLGNATEPTFAAPPLLNQIMLRGEIPAVLNFWHYNARLRAAGMKELVAVADMLPVLGVERVPPLIGWAFSEAWAAGKGTLARTFFESLKEAKGIMADSDAEWDRLRPLMKAEDNGTFVALRDAYRAGIPRSFGPADVAAAEKIFETLARLGNAKLVGDARALAPGTFWAGFRY